MQFNVYNLFLNIVVTVDDSDSSDDEQLSIAKRNANDMFSRSRTMSINKGDENKRKSSRKSETPKFSAIVPKSPVAATVGDKFAANMSNGNGDDVTSPKGKKGESKAAQLGGARDLRDLISQMKSVTQYADGDGDNA